MPTANKSKRQTQKCRNRHARMSVINIRNHKLVKLSSRKPGIPSNRKTETIKGYNSHVLRRQTSRLPESGFVSPSPVASSPSSSAAADVDSSAAAPGRSTGSSGFSESSGTSSIAGRTLIDPKPPKPPEMGNSRASSQKSEPGGREGMWRVGGG